MMIALARVLFALLAFFEVLNYVSVLHFTLVYTWLGLIVTVLGIWVLMETTHRKRAHHPASWFMALAAVGVDAGGDMLKFYQNVPHYDKYVHFAISAAGVAIILFLLARQDAALRGRDYLLALTSIVSLGALYELEEFWESALFHTNRWGGGPDTLTDITANIFGATLAVVAGFIIIHYRRRRALTPQNSTESPAR